MYLSIIKMLCQILSVAFEHSIQELKTYHEYSFLFNVTGELAPAISATVNISGHMVDYVIVHMGNDG